MTARAGHLARLLLSFGLSAAGLWWLASGVAWRDLAAVLAQAQPGPLVLGLAGLAIGYTVRVVRWRIMLFRLDVRIGFGRATAIYLGSLAVNNVLPLRAGDIARIAWVAGREGAGFTRAALSVVVERILDAAILAALFLLAWPRSLESSWGVVALLAGCLGLLSAPWTLAWLTVAAVRVLRHLELSGPAALMLRLAGPPARALRAMRGAWPMPTLVVLTAFVWGGEAVAFAGAAAALGHPLSAHEVALLLAGTTLSTLLPSAPGYVGTFHATFAWLAGLLGRGAADGTALAVVTHLLLWLPTTAGGLLCLPLLGTSKTNEKAVA